MTKSTTIRKIGDFKYYVGSDPKMRSLLRAETRPREHGNKIWATSLTLIKYLEENPFNLKDLRVLEIGCGWGLLGVYLAKVHGCHVTCTDLDELVLPIAQLQADLNGVSIKTKRSSFDEFKQSFLNSFDLIIGAEICYSEEIGRDVIKLVETAFGGTVNHVLIADPGRPDFDDFHKHCEEHYKTELFQLPGSVNGKTTKLVSAYNLNANL